MFELTADNAAAYLGRRLGPGDWRITPLGGGVSNTVLLAETGGRRLVLKQSLPKLRVEEDWPADRERIHREWRSIQELTSLLPPGRMPRVIFVDEPDCLFAMSAAPAGARTWKDHLLAGDADPRIAEAVAATQAEIANATWKSARWESLFGDQTAFEQLRLDPYYRFTAAKHPDLAAAFAAVTEDAHSRRCCLVHGDWSPKNFLVHGDTITAIDFEVIHYGDPSFDAAFLLNHLLLKSFHRPRWRGRYAAAAERFWRTLDDRFTGGAGWLESATVRHLGCLLLARIDGKSPVEYIQDEAVRRRVRALARDIIERPPSSVMKVFEKL